MQQADEYDIAIKAMFCVTIASKPGVKKDIDTIFNKDKVKYITAYKNSDIYNNLLIIGEKLDIVMYAEKIAGILEIAIESQDFNDLYAIGKKAFKKIHSNIKNRTNLSFHDILKYADKTIQGDEDSVAAYYLYFLLDRILSITTNEIKSIAFVTKQRFIVSAYKKINFSKDRVNDKRGFINETREYFGIPKGSHTAREIMNFIYKKDIVRYNAENMLFPDKQLDLNDTRGIESIGQVSKYAGGFEGLFKYLEINTNRMFSETTLTSTEIDELILNIFYCNTFSSFNEDDRKMYFIASLYFYILAKEYKNTKSKYLKDFSDEYLIEIDTLQKKLESNNSEALKAKDLYEKKARLVEESNANLLKEIEQYKKEIKRLEEQVKQNEEAKIENVKLRNLVFNESIDNIEDMQEDELSKEDIDMINNNKNIVILGGSTSWTNKMKEKLPNIVFANLDTKHSNLDFINKNSIVFINTDMKHAFYYKIKSVTSKLNIDYNYISNTSINQSLKDIKNILNIYA